MKRCLTFLYLAFLHSAVSMAAVTINMVEVDGDVVATATGSINTSGLTPTARVSTVIYEGFFRGGLGFVSQGVVGPLNGAISVGQGGGSVDEYIIETTHLFTTGPLWGSQASSGDHVGIISRSDLGDSITVPKGYNSGARISGTSTWPGTTLAAMKAIPGTYVFSWGSGGTSTAGSLTLNIGGAAPPTTYTVGGTITGLTGSVTLQNSGGNNLSRTANGNFTFSNALADNSTYAVSVSTQPAGQTCSVRNGNGTITSANVSNISVSCTNDPAPKNIYSGTLPSGAAGTLSFTSSDSGCAFAEAPNQPQFLTQASVTPAPPEGVSAIDGVVQFTIDGCAAGATVTISMDYGVSLPPGTTYWKAAAPSWYPITNATITGSVVQFSITDGGTGDDDDVAGQITDPSGAVLAPGSAPGTAPGAAANSIPTLSEWALVLLAMLLGLLVFFRREQPA